MLQKISEGRANCSHRPENKYCGAGQPNACEGVWVPPPGASRVTYPSRVGFGGGSDTVKLLGDNDQQGFHAHTGVHKGQGISASTMCVYTYTYTYTKITQLYTAVHLLYTCICIRAYVYAD